MYSFKLLPVLLIVAMVSACGGSSSSTSSDDDSSSTSSQSITMSISEGASSSLTSFAVSTSDSDCDPRGEGTRDDWANASCISPINYTVGISKIELLDCDGGACSESDGSVSETASATVFDVSSTEPSGRAIDLDDGATLSGSDIETVDAGTYGGLRFTITFLKQTIAYEDLDLGEDMGDADLTYMTCAKDGGCQDEEGNAIEDSQAGDIMIYFNDEWNWIDNDNNGNMVTTRPSNPAQDEGFANLGSEDGPDGDAETGFLVEMENDAEDPIEIASTGSYTLTSTFVVGYAFAFDDTDSSGTFSPSQDGEAYPDRPAEINFTAE